MSIISVGGLGWGFLDALGLLQSELGDVCVAEGHVVGVAGVKLRRVELRGGALV